MQCGLYGDWPLVSKQLVLVKANALFIRFYDILKRQLVKVFVRKLWISGEESFKLPVISIKVVYGFARTYFFVVSSTLTASS